ncbi:MAG: glycoside hydrolase family 2 TIM barrel-domain containing protein [Acidobacteriota bacterium]
MIRVLTALLLFLLLTSVRWSSQWAVLASSPLREQISLNSDWRFQRQVTPGSAVEWQFRGAWSPDYDDSQWSRIFLPHSWDQRAHNPWVTINHWRGVGWYRRDFPVPVSAAGRRVLLEFEGASQVSRVWVNGQSAGEHVGGYTGFVLDVTHLIRPGGSNLLAVQVDNTNSPDIPPANETNIANYGGLYRDVWLHITGPVFVPYGGVAITTPLVSRKLAAVRLVTEVRQSLASPVEVRLVSEVLAPDGRVVGKNEEKKTIQGETTVRFEPSELTISEPALWHPDHPSLYSLRSRVYSNGTPTDEVVTRFGIRVMGYEPGKGYTINGEYINLHGVNRRQDYGYLANAVPDSVARRDMEIIKELGANLVRTSHYVQDKCILEAADELGLLVWEEIPNIKIYDYTPGPMTETGDSRYTRNYLDNCLLAMEEMIRRDRNHPSIIIWGIGDDMTGYPYLEDLQEIQQKAHQLDPTRWTAGRVYPMITDVRDPTNNSYFDFRQLAQEHPDWKWLWNEWGAFKNERGNLIEPTVQRTQGHDVETGADYRRFPVPSELAGAIFQEASWIKFEAMPWMATAKWVMFDAGCAACQGTKGIFYFYGPPEARPWGTRFTGGDYRGLSDLWRIPKASYWFVKAQWSDDPFVHIAGHWTWPGQNGKPKMVRIYSTCDEVELFLNGKSLGRKGPETTEALIAEWKGYRMWNDSSPLPRGTKLRHAPFVWSGVPYEPGTLRAVGRKDGQEYSDERKTAGPPSQVILQPDRSRIRTGGREAVRILAVVADSQGVMVPQANPWLKFNSEGPGDLLGTPVLDAVWGMAAINLQSRSTPGEIVVTAASAGLKEGRCVIAATP